jgi:hypothetical protein
VSVLSVGMREIISTTYIRQHKKPIMALAAATTAGTLTAGFLFMGSRPDSADNGSIWRPGTAAQPNTEHVPEGAGGGAARAVLECTGISISVEGKTITVQPQAKVLEGKIDPDALYTVSYVSQKGEDDKAFFSPASGRKKDADVAAPVKVAFKTLDFTPASATAPVLLVDFTNVDPRDRPESSKDLLPLDKKYPGITTYACGNAAVSLYVERLASGNTPR